MNDFTFGPFGNSLGIGPFLFPASPGSDLVSSIHESAVYWGRDGNDTIISFDPGANDLLQIDLLIGDLVDGAIFPDEIQISPRDWQNRFVLGDWQKPYYSSGLVFPFGLNQFAVVSDFNPSLDRIQLHGSSEDYQLFTTSVGTALFKQQFPTPDLIALFPLTEDLTLESDYFQFEGDTPPPGPILEQTEQLGTDGIDSFTSSTTDSLGNIYLTGVTRSDIWIAKYDRDGNQLWLEQLSTSGSESATEIVTDREGNLYLVGVTNGDLAPDNAGSFDVWVAKYDSEGNQLWVEQFGNELVDLSYSIDIDGDGNVYLTGHSGEIVSEEGEPGLLGQTLQPWITKYDTNGNRLWFQEFESSDLTEAYGVVVGSDNQIYATGWTLGDLAEDNAGAYDIWLAQLDSEGNILWSEKFGSEDYEFPWGIDTDSRGNVYITGWTLGELGGDNAGAYDVWLAKYDRDGDRQWIQQFGTSGDDGTGTFFGDLEIDSNDNIYLTGYTDSDLGGANAGSYDPWVAKYDSNGKQHWIRQFGSPNFDYGGSISSDNNGNLYVTGATEGSLGALNAGAIDGWIAKLDAESGALKDFSDDNFNSIGAQTNTLTGEQNPWLTADALNSIYTGLAPPSGTSDLWTENLIGI
ncbi:SBBP repeat-containing protein [Myxosarcina sp. GI1(2024)]